MAPLHQAQLLILRLTPLAPVRCDINSVVLLLVALLLGLMYSCGGVLRRTVHGIQNQGGGTSVDKVVLRARGHDDKVPGLDILLFAGNDRAPLARGKCQNLVNVMDLEIWVSVGSQATRMDYQTSSPISPSTGTVINTSCEYRPVNRTRRNSDDSDGSDVVILAK